MASERQIELNLLLFRVKIRFPQKNKSNKTSECENFTLSRSASDWEFHKMNRAVSKRCSVAKSQYNIPQKCELEDFYSIPEKQKVMHTDTLKTTEQSNNLLIFRKMTITTYQKTHLLRQYMNSLIRYPCRLRKRKYMQIL